MADTTPPDPHVQAAIEEEQQHLDRAIQAAQAQHLMNRCIELNAASRRLTAELADLRDLPSP